MNIGSSASVLASVFCVKILVNACNATSNILTTLPAQVAVFTALITGENTSIPPYIIEFPKQHILIYESTISSIFRI